MHLLFLIPELDDGGPDKVFKTLLNSINNKDIKKSLALVKSSGKYYNELDKSIDIHKLKLSRYPVFSLIQLIEKIKPDIVIATLRMDITACAASILCRHKFKLVIRPANFLTLQLKELKLEKPFKHFFTERIIRKLLLRADYLIAQSNSMKALLIEYKLDPKRIFVIGNPISINEVDDQAKSQLLSFIGVNRGKPEIISLGRLMHQKGFEFLIKAISILKDKYPSIHLTIYGEGAEREKLEKIIIDKKLSNYVSLPGKTKYPYAALKSSDLFICSSRYEGSSNALLESLAIGLPSMSVDTPGSARELILENMTGYMIKELSEKSIAIKIEQFILNPIPNLGQNSRNFIKENFSIEKINNKYLEVFYKCMNLD